MSKPFAKTIKKNQAQEDIQTQLQVVSEQKPEIKRKTFQSLAETVAQDAFFYANYYYEGGREIFENEPKLQTVDKYFPWAEGGPLFIDEPELPYQLDMCNKKSEVMKRLGHRYLILKPGMNELEAVEALV